MSRTWLLRGVAVAVFAVLVGAWAVGLAGLGDDSPSTERPATPVSPDSSPVSDSPRSIVYEKAKTRRGRNAGPSQEALTEPSPDSADEPAADAPGTPAPTSSPTPDQPAPSEDPPDSPAPPQSPSNPPSQPPADECTDLGEVMDCALDPITGHP